VNLPQRMSERRIVPSLAPSLKVASAGPRTWTRPKP
jgi:hypothetical protein